MSTYDTSSTAQAERLQWFRDARFGLFLHWGLYSMLGQNEWAFRSCDYTVDEYARLADRFSPTNFDADAWANFAVECGAKYMVFTARHHDGFCLFDSKASTFTSTNSAAKRDFVAEYVEACRRANLKVGLYYSQGDWRFKGAFNPVKYPDSWDAMVTQAHEQVRELMSHYGPIDVLFYDGLWGWENRDPAEMWKSKERNAMARLLQPNLIISNQSGLPEDYVGNEGSIQPSADGTPWESCIPMDWLGWDHIPRSPHLRTPAQIVRDLVEAAAGAGNLLLNTGPRADGSLEPDETVRIREAGRWLQKHAAAIYRSKRSALHTGSSMGPGGALCRWIGSDNPHVHYLAALGWSTPELRLPFIQGKVRAMHLFPTGEAIQFHQDGRGRLFMKELPAAPPDALATVFRVEFETPPAPVSAQGPDFAERIESDL